MGIAATNWLTWAHNWYLRRWPWANVGVRIWGENFKHGFAWDDGCFTDNQLAHPYHGSWYFNSAHASGYSFWGSLPFVAVGSASWELLGENVRPSLNDQNHTTLGGMAFGEVTYRLSTLIRSSRDGGHRSFGRELGSFGLSPMARTQQLLRRRLQEAGRASEAMTRFGLGQRSGHHSLDFIVQQGSPFDAEMNHPYDAFEFRMQVSPGEGGVIRHVSISGLLARSHLSQTSTNQLVFGVFQHYDFEDLSILKSSGQSFSAAVLYRHLLGIRNQLNLSAHAEGIALGAISSDHDHVWRRDFDYGPGAAVRLGAAWVRDGREWLRFDGRLLWLHSIYGSDGNHRASFLRLGAAVPLVGALGLGGEMNVTNRHSSYPEFAPVSQRVSQLRAYLTWDPS
ncbi:MAG: DUF3943 domain-containing protein [Gemmatimonadales bacterium]